MDLALLEGQASAFYERLGLDPADPVSSFRLARLHLGPESLVRLPQLAAHSARLSRVNGRRVIAFSTRVPDAYQRFAVAHELAHAHFEDVGHRSETIEVECDALGAMLMAPMPAVRALFRALGSDFAAHAEVAGSTETWAALRLAEVLGVPRAILTPQRLYVRAPESWVLPDEATLRLLAKGRARPGITRARLGDDPRRWVLDFEDVETG